MSATGEGSAIKNVLGTTEALRSNTNIGTTNGSNVLVEILGSGNSYDIDVTARSLMMGDSNSTTGANKILISSSDSSKRNTFNISGVNAFVKMSKSAESIAKNTISIGDNTDATFTVSAKIGGSENTELAGGSATLQMIGTNSNITFKRDSHIGNENSGGSQSGGSSKISVLGSGNTFYAVGTTLRIGYNSAMSGGEAMFEIGGENNTVTWQNIQIGNASSTGGVAKVSVKGSTHTIRATDQFQVRGSEVVTEGTVSAVNGGMLEFVSDSEGISTVNVGRVTGFDGILSLDFSKLVAEKDSYFEFQLVSANYDWSSIASKLLTTSEDANAHLNVVTKNAEDSWEMIYNGNSLYITYNYVPEPSTYALIFGCLAFGFIAIYRKKK